MVKGNQERGRNKSQDESSKNKSQSKLRKRKDITSYKQKRCILNGIVQRKRKGMQRENRVQSANVVEEDSESRDSDMLSISSSSDLLLCGFWIQHVSYHLTPYKDWSDAYRVNSGSVLMGNAASCKVIGIENVIIKMFDGAVRTLCC